jgi:hypothetical protein
MDAFMNRLRNENGARVRDPGVGTHKKVIADPKMMALDQLMIDYTSEIDLKLQDENSSALSKIQDQIEKCSN